MPLTLSCGADSTHSRLKAAGPRQRNGGAGSNRFNTQPPEGGWVGLDHWSNCFSGFNTQPPEGGWRRYRFVAHTARKFQHTAA